MGGLLLLKMFPLGSMLRRAKGSFLQKLSNVCNRQCGNALRGFINRSREPLSEDTIQILKKRVEECFRLANESLIRER